MPESTSSVSEVMTLSEAARFVRVSEKTLAGLARERKIPGRRVGREWRFLRSALEHWLTLGTMPARVQPSPGLFPEDDQIVSRSGDGQPGFGDTAFALNRDSTLHRWVPWVAGYSASFVGDVIEREERRYKSPMVVLDPFAGVGTTLAEAMLRGHDSVGYEINPYAALACKVKLCCPLFNLRVLQEYVDWFRAHMRDGSPQSRPPEGFRSRVPFFSPEVEAKVLLVLDFVAACPERWVKEFFQVALGAVMVGFSNYTYEPSLGTRQAAGKPDVIEAPVTETVYSKVQDMLADVERVQSYLKRYGRVPRADVYRTSFLEPMGTNGPRKAHLLITSPPYLNNYHYIRNTRPQLYWLGLVSGRRELREMENASFGKFWQTVRSGPRVALEVDDSEIQRCLDTVRRQNTKKGPYGGEGWANYAATYFNDCQRLCHRMRDMLRRRATAVVVLGNNILQGVEVPTDVFFARIAEQAGFEVIELHTVREKRTGNSIVNSSVRVDGAESRVTLHETAVELRLP